MFHLIHLVPFIKAIGYLGVAGIVFAESGLLIGFFLPGDSLLFTAGFLASQGFLNIWVLAILSFLAAVIGDSVGYYIGKATGSKIFTRPKSLFFKPSNIEKANKFFKENGPKTLILARFIPVVRTFVPVIAGVGEMKYRTFLIYNIVGGALWTIGVSTAGFFLGKVIPDFDKYLLPIVILIAVISILPSAIHLIRSNKKN